MALSKLCFGIEIELLLSPRNHPEHTTFRNSLLEHGWTDHVTSSPTRPDNDQAREGNRFALRSAIAERLQVEGKVPAQTEEDFNGYDAWTVCGENLDEPPSYWGAELTSRIMTTDEDWQAELGRVFGIVSKYCHILLTWDCSMHVHVSPDRIQTFTDIQLQALCKGLCYYDEATTAALPGDRKNNVWAPRNLELPPHPFSELRIVQNAYSTVMTGSWAPLFQLLDEITRADVSRTVQDNSKSVGWNFLNIYRPDGHGTVEFRRPPGVDSARKAAHWTAFVLGLFSESITFDWINGRFDEKFSQLGVDDLRSFIASGLQRLGPNCEGAIVEDWVVEDRSAETTDTQKTAKVKEWEKENSRVEAEWVEQGLIEFPSTLSSSEDEERSQEDSRSDSSWSSTEGADMHVELHCDKQLEYELEKHKENT